MSDNREKLMVYLVIGFISIILIIVIITIWKPSSTNLIQNQINNYDSKLSYENERYEYYQKNIINILNSSNFSSTYNNLSEEFLKENNLTDYDATYEYLQKNMYIGSSIEINNISLINKANDIYVYRITYTIGGNTRYVIITENEVNSYSLFFNETGTIKNIVTEKVIVNNDVEYKISVLESKNDSIKIKLTVTNNSIDRYEFDFSNLYSAVIITEDNQAYNLATLALSGNDIYYLNNNSSFNIELVYQIPQEQQSKIERFVFKDVGINDAKQNVIVYY